MCVPHLCPNIFGRELGAKRTCHVVCKDTQIFTMKRDGREEYAPFTASAGCAEAIARKGVIFSLKTNDLQPFQQKFKRRKVTFWRTVLDNLAKMKRPFGRSIIKKRTFLYSPICNFASKNKQTTLQR